MQISNFYELEQEGHSLRFLFSVNREQWSGIPENLMSPSHSNKLEICTKQVHEVKQMENKISKERLDDGMKITVVKNSIQFQTPSGEVYYKNFDNFMKVIQMALTNGKRSVFTYAPKSNQLQEVRFESAAASAPAVPDVLHDIGFDTCTKCGDALLSNKTCATCEVY